MQGCAQPRPCYRRVHSILTRTSQEAGIDRASPSPRQVTNKRQTWAPSKRARHVELGCIPDYTKVWVTRWSVPCQAPCTCPSIAHPRSVQTLCSTQGCHAEGLSPAPAACAARAGSRSISGMPRAGTGYPLPAGVAPDAPGRPRFDREETPARSIWMEKEVQHDPPRSMHSPAANRGPPVFWASMRRCQPTGREWGFRYRTRRSGSRSAEWRLELAWLA